MAKILYSEQAIDECLTRLGKELGQEYQGKNILVLSVLKGGFMFTADLIRKSKDASQWLTRLVSYASP
jgi:hypoxanthine phosphoribosyltransferase